MIHKTVLILFKWLDHNSPLKSFLVKFKFSALWCSKLLIKLQHQLWRTHRENISDRKKRVVICWMTWKRRWFILITLLFKPHRKLCFKIVWCFLPPHPKHTSKQPTSTLNCELTQRRTHSSFSSTAVSVSMLLSWHWSNIQIYSKKSLSSVCASFKYWNKRQHKFNFKVAH